MFKSLLPKVKNRENHLLEASNSVPAVDNKEEGEVMIPVGGSARGRRARWRNNRTVTRRLLSSPSRENKSCAQNNTQTLGLHHRKSPPSKAFRNLRGIQWSPHDCTYESSSSQIGTEDARNNEHFAYDSNKNSHRVVNSKWWLKGGRRGEQYENDNIAERISTTTAGYIGDRGRDGRQSGLQKYSTHMRFDKDIFQILKLGVLVFGTIGLFTVWKMDTISVGSYFITEDHGYGNATAFADIDTSDKSLHRKPFQNNVPKNFSSFHEEEDFYKPNFIDHGDGKDILRTESESSSILRGPKPQFSQATIRYLSWKDEKRQEFIEKNRLMQHFMKNRTQSRLHMHKDNHDPQYYKSYNFDFLNKKNNNNFIKDKDAKNDTANYDEKHAIPCSLAAQKASKRYPHLYPDIHTINENSVVVISGILSRIGFHLALKLAKECNVRNIIGIDPMLPNTKRNRLKILDQLHKLYRVVPKLKQNLIIPYVGFNPKDVYNHHHAKYVKEHNGELDFASFEPTHVVHLVSTDAYRSSSLDGSDSVYLETPMNEIGDDERLGNHIFGLRQSLLGVDHLLSSLISDRSNEDTPIHFTFVSTLQSSKIKDGTTIHETTTAFEKSSTVRSKTKLMEEILLEMYKKESIDVDTFVVLRFPFVYGPWGKEGDIDHDLAEIAVKHWHDTFEDNMLLNQMKMDGRHYDWEEEILFVDGKTNMYKRFFCRNNYSDEISSILDAVDLIITSMQYRKNEHSEGDFQINTGVKVSASSFAHFLEKFMPANNDYLERGEIDKLIGSKSSPMVDPVMDYLNFESASDIFNGTAQLLAWHLNQKQPDKTRSSQSPQEIDMKRTSLDIKETGYEFLKRLNLDNCEHEDIACLRGLSLYPCSSECSDSSMCKTTGFDEAALQARQLTQNCENVLYTSSFGKNVKSINISAPKMMGSNFCTVAFVSMGSKLLYENTDSIHNGWSLIGVEMEGSSIKAETKWLPKLSPSELFHPKVRYAIYLQDDLQKSPSGDDISFIISLMTSQKLDLLGNIQETKEAMVLLSALESNTKQVSITTSDIIPSVAEARDKILGFRGISQNFEKQALQHRISLSQQALMLLNRCEFSSHCKRSYKYKLRHWVKTKWVVHDLQSYDAKRFRCSWFKEQTKLNDDYDEVSFAHVMAVKELDLFLELNKNQEKNEDNILRDEMLDQQNKDEIPQWVPISRSMCANSENTNLAYAHVLTTQRLVEERRRYNYEQEHYQKNLV